GGDLVTGWELAPAGLGPKGIWRAPLPMSLERPKGLRQVYVNGVRGVMARHPNLGAYFRIASWNPESGSISVPPAAVAQAPVLTSAKTELVIKREWIEPIVRV